MYARTWEKKVLCVIHTSTMLWFLASALAWCNHTECLQIAEWLEYTPFPLADERSVRLCVANMVDHTLSMSSGECPNEDVYTCFDCAPSDDLKGCGTHKCGGRHAGICLQGRCECYPGFTLDLDSGACQIDH